jgi:hypothetical protein
MYKGLWHRPRELGIPFRHSSVEKEIVLETDRYSLIEPPLPSPHLPTLSNLDTLEPCVAESTRNTTPTIYYHVFSKQVHDGTNHVSRNSTLPGQARRQ